MTIKKAAIIGLILEILIGCAAGAFYFKFYIYTPTYSIRAMQKAMESGDVEDLQRRVDLDAIFQGSSAKLAQLVPQTDPVYSKLADGSFARDSQQEFLSYVKNGKWPEVDTITAESAFQDKIGLRTISFRNLEYVYRDSPPGEENQPEVGTAEKLLSFGMSLINKYTSDEEGAEAGAEEAMAAQSSDGPIIVTAGVRIYEPNYGDTYILKLKLQRQEDGSWRLFDIENYQEFADVIIKQNDRDYTRYKEKVRFMLTATQEKLDELNGRYPNHDMDWIIEARKIMESSNEELDGVKVPVAGAYLRQLLDEREDCFQEMLEGYYDRQAQEQTMAETREKAAEALKAGKRGPSYSDAVWNQRLSKADERISEALKSWAENKSKLEAIVGSVIDRAAVAQTVAAMLRNNDDNAVKMANYPGTGYASPASGELKGDTGSLFGDGELPEVSAYGQAKIEK